MPELPEVETVKNTLKRLILGEKIKDVNVIYQRIVQNVTIEDFRESLIGQTFKDILRRGKYLIFILDNVILLSHLRMEGKYFIKKDEEVTKHEHVIFKLESNKTLRYHDTRKFGVMYLYKNKNVEDILKEAPLLNIGYEPFDNELTVDYLKERLKKITKPIKSTLLDQSIISGLGNIYVDEVLFMSNIHPLEKTNSLSNQALESIIINSQRVLDKAIALGGTTIHSFSVDGISGKFQNELLVHTKDICPNCHKKILKIRVGGRGTYLCEDCQKRMGD